MCINHKIVCWDWKTKSDNIDAHVGYRCSMTIWCVSAISALHPSIAALGFTSRFRSDIADTHLEVMLYILHIYIIIYNTSRRAVIYRFWFIVTEPKGYRPSDTMLIDMLSTDLYNFWVGECAFFASHTIKMYYLVKSHFGFWSKIKPTVISIQLICSTSRTHCI